MHVSIQLLQDHDAVRAALRKDGWHIQPEERPDGMRVWFTPYPTAIRDSAGKIVGGINMLLDITERKQAEERLRRAAEFDEAVMTNMGEGLYTVDNEGRVTSMNPAAERLFGWTLDELRGHKMHDMTHYKHLDGSPFPAEECAGLQVLREGKTLADQEDVFLRKDGTFFDVIYSSAPIQENGKITGLVVVFRDMTERKRAEARLRENEERFRNLFELGSVAVYSCDAVGVIQIIQMFNPRAAELWGRAPATGERFCGSFKLYRPDGTFMPHEQCPMGDVLTGKIPAMRDGSDHRTARRLAGCRHRQYSPVEGRTRRDRGSDQLLLRRHRTQARGGSARPAAAIVSSSDDAIITQRKQAEEAPRAAQAQLTDRANQLEQAVAERTAELTETNKQLEAFVYSIAHDLRAPLRSMEGFSAMLVEEAGSALSETGQDFAKRISRSAQFMDTLLQELMAFSRTAQQRIELTNVNLEAVVRSALSRLEKAI